MKLEAAPSIPISLPGWDESREVNICPYEAVEAINSFREEDESGWREMLQDWLAQKLDVEASQLDPYQVITFNNLACAMVESLNAERKKKVDSMLCSLLSTPESPATSPSGQNGSSGTG